MREGKAFERARVLSDSYKNTEVVVYKTLDADYVEQYELCFMENFTGSTDEVVAVFYNGRLEKNG